MNNLIEGADISKKQLLSIIVPVFNEATILPVFHQTLCAECRSLDLALEVIYVNDGSEDNTLSILQDLKNQDVFIIIIDFSRNFGKEIAIQAGLDYSQGEAVVVMDADLQHPPPLIPEFIKYWRKGYDVVYAIRTVRAGESWLKRSSAYLFYSIIEKISHTPIPRNTGDFRLLDRRAVEALKLIRERHRFMKGLFSWIGYKQIGIPFEDNPRFEGQTKWNYRKLLNLAMEGITSFTIAPLRLATWIGFLTALFAFVYAIVIIYKTLMFGEPIQGYPSLMVMILFLGGVQLITLGIIGEYLGRMFDETKQRPLYLVKQFYKAGSV